MTSFSGVPAGALTNALAVYFIPPASGKLLLIMMPLELPDVYAMHGAGEPLQAVSSDIDASCSGDQELQPYKLVLSFGLAMCSMEDTWAR